eukprot:s1034_g12.t1
MPLCRIAFLEVGASSMESIDFEVSRGTSFHLPVNRVLAFLIHQLCIRTPGSTLHTAGSSGSILDQAFKGVGMAESDIQWWMEHSLRALVLQSQVMAGMWRRNGEALEHESEFYRMNYWHHMLMDADLLVVRLSALMIRPEAFFRTTLQRFELWSWLQPGDPLARLLSYEREQDKAVDPYGMQKLQSYVLFLYQLLSSNSPLSLTWSELVTHTTRQFLGVGPKSHSQLWDPRLERSTATAMAADQQTLERALREISDFHKADGSSHAPAKYCLREAQWFRVDPYFHLFSWSEQQKVEENLTSALKAGGHHVADWVEESAPQQPKIREVYQEAFLRFCCSGMVQAFCWLLLVRIAFRPDKREDFLPDGRLLVLTLLLALRATSVHQDASSAADSVMEMDLPTDQLQLFWLSQAMGPNLHLSAKRRFSIKVKSSSAEEAVMDASLIDAVERLAIPKESLSGSLARALQKRLEQPQEAAKVQPPQPAQPSGSKMDAATEAPRGTDQEEDRKAKRRKAAQERQQRMLDSLRKRQAAFISEAGQRYDEETPAHSPETETSPNPADSDQGSMAECVVCMSHQEEDPDPLGLICFLRPAIASSVPRARVPTEQAVLLQPPRAPFGGAFRTRPQCFDPCAPDGLVLARACSHRMHFSCWKRFRTSALNANGGRLSCPYCGTVANALLPVSIPQNSRCRGVSQIAQSDGPTPPRHAEATADFLSCLEGQLSKLGSEHKQPDLAQVIGATSHPFMSLSKLCADNIALAEVRARTKPAAEAVSTIASQAARAPAMSSSNPTKRPLDGTVTSAAHALVLQGIIEEAVDVVPPFPNVQPLMYSKAYAGKLAQCLLTSTPHTRFQTLVALLLCLTKEKSQLGRAGRWLVHGFYLLEALIVLTAMADSALIESQAQESLEGSSAALSLWDWAHFFAKQSAPASGVTPIHSIEEATDVLRLALNPFLYKVRLLLFLIAPDEFPSGRNIFTSADLEVLLPMEDHARLTSAEYGLPEVEDLLLLRPGSSVELAALTQLLGGEAIFTHSPRGRQPASPLLLVLVGDSVAEAPSHVWQMSFLGFERLHASGCQVGDCLLGVQRARWNLRDCSALIFYCLMSNYGGFSCHGDGERPPRSKTQLLQMTSLMPKASDAPRDAEKDQFKGVDRDGILSTVALLLMACVAFTALGWLWRRPWSVLVAVAPRRFCVAGVALGYIVLRFVWQAWHFVAYTSLLWGRRGVLVAALVGAGRCGAAPLLRGRCGAWRHLPSLCGGVALGNVHAGVALAALGCVGAGRCGSAPLLHGRRDAATSAFVLCGRRGIWWHPRAFRVARAALAALGWLWWRPWSVLGCGASWHLATSAFLLCFGSSSSAAKTAVNDRVTLLATDFLACSASALLFPLHVTYRLPMHLAGPACKGTAATGRT